MEALITAALVVLVIYALLGAVDGLYLHLWRYRLHARPESRREHLWHTARAALFPLWVGALFALPTAGPALWVGVAIAGLDLLAAAADVLEEYRSRAGLGGLPRGEYALHLLLSTLHAAALALALASRPIEAWGWGSAPLGAPLPELVQLVALNLLPGAVLVAIAHVALAARPDLLPAAPLPAARGATS